MLGGYMPARDVPKADAIEAPPLEYFKESLGGSGGREVSTHDGVRARAERC